jgi:hypothetical protein
MLAAHVIREAIDCHAGPETLHQLKLSTHGVYHKTVHIQVSSSAGHDPLQVSG